ncbi:L,D-transpeptidase family protein [Aureimonas sp. AU20]|uniref:L,D-transpeptidase family protein n=1 Tax=Aureimonas sp. AU20 TaxID=1349819 RepID=UPI0009EC7B30
MSFFPVQTRRKASKTAEISVRASALDLRKGVLQFGPLRLRCALGKGGVSSFKREGDGATPLASMALLWAYGRPGRRGAPRFALPTRTPGRRSGWCDAPEHGCYNRPVRLPFPASAERLLRDDRLYDGVVVLDWNVRHRRRGLGSAIFLHVARPGYAPTEGCVALSRRDLDRLAPHLRTGLRLIVRR